MQFLSAAGAALLKSVPYKSSQVACNKQVSIAPVLH